MTWRPAKCLPVLRDEINKAYPNRTKAQDGIIGNAEHASRASDHNPDSHGVVHAIDIDARGIPAQDIVNHIHALAVAGDKRMVGGYLIFNRRIASHTHAWVWRDYTGPDPHNLHFHLSCTYEAACDSTAPWGVTGTIDQGEPDVNDRQNQIIENLEKRTSDIAGALGDIQKSLQQINDRLAQPAAGNTGNTASIAGNYTITVKDA